MTTQIVSDDPGCQARTDDGNTGCQSWYANGVEKPGIGGMVERIERVMAPLSARAFSEKCGLAPTVVSTTLARLREDPLRVELRTLDAIARGGGVALQWLLFGEGQKAAQDPAEHRPAAAARARGEGVPAAAIESVLADEVDATTRRRTVDWWVLRMRMRAVELSQDAVSARASGAPTPTPGTLRTVEAPTSSKHRPRRT